MVQRDFLMTKFSHKKSSSFPRYSIYWKVQCVFPLVELTVKWCFGVPGTVRWMVLFLDASHLWADVCCFLAVSVVECLFVSCFGGRPVSVTFSKLLFPQKNFHTGSNFQLLLHIHHFSSDLDFFLLAGQERRLVKCVCVSNVQMKKSWNWEENQIISFLTNVEVARSDLKLVLRQSKG